MLQINPAVTKRVELVLPSMHPKQKDFYSRPERFVVGCMGSKFGKLLSLNTMIPTPYGEKELRDIHVGDEIFSEDGSITRVIDETPVMDNEDCYKVIFSNGYEVIAGAEHLWKVFSFEKGTCIDFSLSLFKQLNSEEVSKFYVALSPCYSYLSKKGVIFSANGKDYISIISIAPVSSVPVKCITVAHPSGMFLIGDRYVPTHNSFGGALKLTELAWNNPGWILWWVAPGYAQCQIGIDEIKKFLPRERYYHYRKQPQVIELLKSNGQPHSRIEFKSADDPDNLRGFKVNKVLIDEADRISDESYHSVYTTLLAAKGSAFIISTPKTRGGFFFKEFQKGLPDSPNYDPSYFSMTMPTSANPWVDPDVLEQARKNLEEDVFRTEYLAEWPASEGGSVFREFNGCILQGARFVEPEAGKSYIVGADLAKHEDFTVLTVMDRQTRTVVNWERFNQLDWKIQKHRIVEVCRKYNRALLVMDTTGIGDVIIDDLRDTADFPIMGYKISSNTLKRQLVEALKMVLLNKTIYFPEIRELIFELKMFEYRMLESGNIVYGACSGTHDDCVISLAMAVHGLDQEPFVYKHFNMRGI